MSASSFHLESESFEAHRLQLRSFRGVERIGAPFVFEIDAVVPDAAGLDRGQLLGSLATLVIDTGSTSRRFHGLIAGIKDALQTTADHRSYTLRLVPRAQQLALVTTQDIFQNLSVPDVIAAKLEHLELGADGVAFRLAGTYPVREFIVQYRETDLAFISRLAEHLGISMLFEHGEEGDRIVFTDHEAGFGSIEGESATFRGTGERTDVYQLSLEQQLVPASYITYDYNYRLPQVEVRGIVESDTGFAGGMAEYGPHAKTPEEAELFARLRRDELRGTERVYRGESDLATFRAGAHVAVENHPHVEGNPLLLVEVEHRGTQPALLHGGGSEPPRYENSFRAVPSGFVYRPPRVTPTPRVHGFATGIIEGYAEGSSGNAKLDDEGRYTVRFHFDIAPREAMKASRPVRMAQQHAGAGYGTHFPLRPGVEVLLAFHDGDPDRPVIVGAMPNPMTPTPITLTNAGHNMIRTRSGVRLHINDGHTRGSE